MNRTAFLLIALLLLGLAGSYAIYLGYSNGWKTTIAPGAGKPVVVPEVKEGTRSLGRLHPAGGVINVSATLGDRLESFAEGIAEGTEIESGAPIGFLASLPQRRLEVESLELEIAEAEARLEGEKTAAESQVDRAKLAVELLEEQGAQDAARTRQNLLLEDMLALESKTLNDLIALGPETFSQSEVDRQRLAVGKVETEIAANKATAAELAGKRKAAAADLKAAQANLARITKSNPLESLKKRLEIARLAVKNSQVVSPCGGTILKIFTRPGEQIGARPILQIADLRQMIVLAEVYKSQVHEIQPGRSAEITSDVFHGKTLSGVVRRIGLAASTPELKHLDPLSPSDPHAIEVEIEIKYDAARRETMLEHLVNLPVEVLFPAEKSPPAASPQAAAQPAAVLSSATSPAAGSPEQPASAEARTD